LANKIEFAEEFSSSKDKYDNFEKDKKRLLDEKEQYKINLDNLQKLFIENDDKNRGLTQVEKNQQKII
jgi:hypothetical protein